MTDRLCRCGHTDRSHRECRTPEELAALALVPGTGCCFGDCGCEAFVHAEPAPPRDARLRHANAQQREAIQRLAAAIGFTLCANWDAFPTGKTRGLKMSEMFFAAHVHSLANLLAGASHTATEEQRANLLSLADAMLRDVFPHALTNVQRVQQGESVDETPSTTPVLVPAPKLVM